MTTAETLTIHIAGTPADAVTVFTAGRVLERRTPSGPAVATDITIPAAALGPGEVTLHATAFLENVAVANAMPITVRVTDQPSSPVTPQSRPPESGGPSR